MIVLQMQPDHADAYNNMGLALKSKGDSKSAIDKYKRAIAIQPDHAKAYLNMGDTLEGIGEIDKALDSYYQSAKIKPDYAEAYYNIGNALGEKTQTDEAIKNYQEAIRIKPDYAEAFNNLGLILGGNGDLNAAMENYKKAIKFKPDYAESYNNIGNIFKDIGDVAAAINSFDKALEIKSDYAEANCNQSLVYLYNADFKVGWDKYEWRWKTNANESIPLLSINPTWSGSRDERVLLWAEQGIGDEIMFASIIQDLHASCSKLIVQIDERLITLFERSFPNSIDFRPTGVPILETEYDAHIPIGSLPQHFRQTTDSFKSTSHGWLFACDEKVSDLRKKVLPDTTQTLIGISWHSTKPRRGAEYKLITLTQLAKRLHAPGVKLVNLQYGDVDAELEDLRKNCGIDVVQVSEINNKNDIDGLSALIMACDKVVSISNVTIHLAGALGKEAHVLLASSCDWRWGRKRNSVWYDTVRLHRQTKFNDWENVLKQL